MATSCVSVALLCFCGCNCKGERSLYRSGNVSVCFVYFLFFRNVYSDCVCVGTSSQEKFCLCVGTLSLETFCLYVGTLSLSRAVVDADDAALPDPQLTLRCSSPAGPSGRARRSRNRRPAAASPLPAGRPSRTPSPRQAGRGPSLLLQDVAPRLAPRLFPQAGGERHRLRRLREALQLPFPAEAPHEDPHGGAALPLPLLQPPRQPEVQPHHAHQEQPRIQHGLSAAVGWNEGRGRRGRRRKKG